MELGLNAGAEYSQISSLAFENGRKNFQNIFVCAYEGEAGEGGGGGGVIKGGGTKSGGTKSASNPSGIPDGCSIIEGSETELSDLNYLPFRINTSVKIPEGVSTFPGITLEAPFDLGANATDSWTCRVVLPKTVTSFSLYGSYSSSSGADDTNQIVVCPSYDPSESFSLNSDKGTIEVYMLDHTSLPELDLGNYDTYFNAKFFVNETVFNELNFESEEEANSYGFYLKAKKISGFEAKVAEALGTSSLDIEVNPLENSKIDEVFSIPTLEVLSYYDIYDEDLGEYVIIGTIKVLSNDQNQVKYIDFTRSESNDGPGPITSAKYYALVDNVKVGNENVSSYLSIKDGQNEQGDYETTFSFRGASATSGIKNPEVVIK